MRQMELKVFGGTAHVNGKMSRVILAVSSQRAAVAALYSSGLDVTMRQLIAYWPITRAASERKVALASPGVVFASPLDSGEGFNALPKIERTPTPPPPPKVPTDPELRKAYDKDRREASDAAKRARGERRISSWLPPEAAAALDKLTGGDESRGAVQAALTLALTTCAARHKA